MFSGHGPATAFDAFLLLSFGGPESAADVEPYLDRVLRGRRLPPARRREIAAHYAYFGGKSPINDQNRALLSRLERALAARHMSLPVYLGNRNWHPLILDTLNEMADAGVRHALALITSPFGSYSSCRQYLDEVEEARREIGPHAPRVSKLRTYFNHPRFVEAWCDRIQAATAHWSPEQRRRAQVFFSVHSLPVKMPGCDLYVAQAKDLAAILAARLSLSAEQWQLVYQSRSGPPQQPWLEPDVRTAIAELGARRPGTDLLLVPMGFVSDHVEVLYDLDVDAYQVAAAADIRIVRVRTVGTHPAMVQMICELIEERQRGDGQRPVLGVLGPAPDECPADCCRAP